MKLPSVWVRPSSVRQVVTVLLLALVVFACGKEEGQPRATGHPATAPPKVRATMEPALPPPSISEALPTTRAERAAAPEPPAQSAPQRPKGEINLPAKLGAVTFDHERHAGEPGAACATCHHPSRPQKPLAS